MRTPDGVAETQFLQNFGPFRAKLSTDTFSNRLNYKGVYVRSQTISIRPLKSALRDRESLALPRLVSIRLNKNRKLSR